MKKQTQTSIDGFIPRRSGAQLGNLHASEEAVPIDRSLHTGDGTSREVVGVARESKSIGRSDIDESLRQIDDPNADRGTRRQRRAEKRRRKKANQKPKNKTKRIIKWVLIGLGILVVAIIGYLAFKAINASDSIFKGNVLDLVKSDPLKQDANGRSNFLIVGTSEDDPGHQGANLTDTIMVLSINQKTKDAYTFSVPRDLEVQYGQACPSGYSGKINVYFSCVNTGTDAASEQDRLAKTQAFVGNIIGMDIQYGVHVNYTVVRDVIKAIGGSITVNIEGDNGQGPQPNLGIMDSNFDWKCGATIAIRKKNCPPNGRFIEYGPGNQVLDAERALYLAQARGDVAPTYGLAQSNFDRERNQQKIVLAIREKALSTGVLTNISAVTQLINALGNNLRTNIQTKEIRTLMGLAKDIPSDKITSIDLFKAGEAVFTASGQPVQGQYEYSAIQAYINKIITQEPFVKEKPRVIVLNGGAAAGVAQTEADKLTAKGFTVDSVDNAPDGTYPAVTVYQVANNKPLTAAKLKELYGVTLLTTKPPVSVVGTTDFVVIIGPTQ
ncbi:MAG: LytR family transcriptional regulator [Candidatus Microsaccharimonas sossegonensis]|uniref:LytR family transcriptional regulator n=1 Tax=Candidatus Microsaccharimonas sossegonensis TaxID=2506948 RepID=A0A4Q0AHB7_9BACT|nr:MAG: LytR family transcriptional regulator [Candidatus Microsaccharimonas sossegonensis]